MGSPGGGHGGMSETISISINKQSEKKGQIAQLFSLVRRTKSIEYFRQNKAFSRAFPHQRSYQ